ncbi:MAG: holo-ACP synthase [Puniceicoccales bacterium]|nr:holo-ACP synthase [Puniceicoccales bacterium]
MYFASIGKVSEEFNAAIVDVALGTDIVETARIEHLVRRFGDVFLRKIFNGDEIAYCMKMANPAMGFAARFATKEAFSKAMGTGIGRHIGWKDVSVGKKSSGEPFIALSERAAATLKARGYSAAKVSIAHTKTLAHAVVVLIKLCDVPGASR